MDPKVWGPPAWRFMHLLASSCNTEVSRLNFRKYIDEFGKLIPCEVCKAHFAENRRKYDITNYMKDEEALLMWTFLMHDAVNFAQGKKGEHRPSWLEVRAMYFKTTPSDGNAQKGSSEDYDPTICSEVCQETLMTIIKKKEETKTKKSVVLRSVKRR